MLAGKNSRQYFPFFNEREGLVYLDNAATTQKPLAVIESLRDYYVKGNVNIDRGSYFLSRQAEDSVLGVRRRVAELINGSSEREIIFTSGATEGLNMVARSYGEVFVEEGDEVIVSVMEHHSNFLPWERLCRERKAHLRVVPLTEAGSIDLSVLERMLTVRTKVVAINHVSHVLGSVNPIAKISEMVHKVGGVIVVDGTQALGHLKVDVSAMGCDFFVFSGHKMYGPMGVGVLYGKGDLLDKMKVDKIGGGMVKRLGVDHLPVYEALPYRFEAGTLNIGGIMGLGGAIDFLQEIGYEEIGAHEQGLMAYFREKMGGLSSIVWLGAGMCGSVGIASFNVRGVHPLDVGMRLDGAGIAVRTGSFCAYPLMQYLGVEGGVRISFAVYNTWEEIDVLVEVLRRYFP